MTARQYFEASWQRCDQLSTLHSYLASAVSSVLTPDELLRAEWVARVSALDLYFHELVAQSMLAIFEGRRQPTPAYLRFKVSAETVERIRHSPSQTDASSAFDLDVRAQFGVVSFQDPEKIADGVRLISPIELWNELALSLGATASMKAEEAKKLKSQLSIIVRRRNQIAHEGDLQPMPVRDPWPIAKSDLTLVRSTLATIVERVDVLV